jgi:hypothetical protein
MTEVNGVWDQAGAQQYRETLRQAISAIPGSPNVDPSVFNFE